MRVEARSGGGRARAITRAVTWSTWRNILFWHLTTPPPGPADVFAAEIMRSFTSRPGYHANSYDAASHRAPPGGKITFPIHETSVISGRGGRRRSHPLEKSTRVFSHPILLPFRRVCTFARVSTRGKRLIERQYYQNRIANG